MTSLTGSFHLSSDASFAGSFKGILVDKLSDLLKEVQRESPSQLILVLQIHTQICFWAAFISVNQLRQF